MPLIERLCMICKLPAETVGELYIMGGQRTKSWYLCKMCLQQRSELEGISRRLEAILYEIIFLVRKEGA